MRTICWANLFITLLFLGRPKTHTHTQTHRHSRLMEMLANLISKNNELSLVERAGHVFESQFHMAKCGNGGFTSSRRLHITYRLEKAPKHPNNPSSAALRFSPIIVWVSSFVFSVIVVCIITCYYHFICLPAQLFHGIRPRISGQILVVVPEWPESKKPMC